MKYDAMYMDMATRISQESKCPRKHVGCVILLESGLLAAGFNGHASGGPNEWEWKEDGDPEVVHAELNAMGKLLEQGVSAKDAVVYLTLSPCLECAKLLVRANVKRVVFMEQYRNLSGLEYLEKYGIKIEIWDKLTGRSNPFVIHTSSGTYKTLRTSCDGESCGGWHGETGGHWTRCKAENPARVDL